MKVCGALNTGAVKGTQYNHIMYIVEELDAGDRISKVFASTE